MGCSQPEGQKPWACACCAMEAAELAQTLRDAGCTEEAAAAHEGLEQEDVPVLKLLFLLRWVDDVKLNVGNIVTLMTDDVRADRQYRLDMVSYIVRDALGKLA